MPKRTNDFQALIKTIYEQIVPEGGAVTESGEVYDKEAGIFREVDILVEYKYAGHTSSFIVECRDRSRSETVEWIDGLVGKTKAMDVNKVIAVSSKGFAQAAKRKAKKNGIETLTLEAAKETDWHKFLKLGVTVMSDEIYNIKDILYKDGQDYISLITLGLDSSVEVNGEIAGDLRGVIEDIFHHLLIPQTNEYLKNERLKLFKTKADLEKTLLIEREYYNSQKIYVVGKDGSRTKLKKIKFVVLSNRGTRDVDQEHHVFNEKLISTGKHLNPDGSTIKFFTVQDPETKKIHLRHEIRDNNGNS